jgi:hypothetical protein
VPHQDVRVAHGAIDVAHQRVEPDDARREARVGRVHQRVEHHRAGKIVDREVEAAAVVDQRVDLGIRLGPRQVGIELGEDDFRYRQAEGASDLSRDQLGDERFRALPGAAELEDVHPLVIRFDDRRQRSSLAKRRDVAGHADGSEPGHSAHCSQAGKS